MIFMFDMNVIKHVMNIIDTYASHATLMIFVPPVYIVVAGIWSAIYRSNKMSKRKATYGRSDRGGSQNRKRKAAARKAIEWCIYAPRRGYQHPHTVWVMYHGYGQSGLWVEGSL